MMVQIDHGSLSIQQGLSLFFDMVMFERPVD